MNDWIDATEQLPERSGEYIAYIGTLGVAAADFGVAVVGGQRIEPGQWSYRGRQTPGAVTHWMPLPVGPHPMVAKHPRTARAPEHVMRMWDALTAARPWLQWAKDRGAICDHVIADVRRQIAVNRAACEPEWNQAPDSGKGVVYVQMPDGGPAVPEKAEGRTTKPYDDHVRRILSYLDAAARNPVHEFPAGMFADAAQCIRELLDEVMGANYGRLMAVHDCRDLRSALSTLRSRMDQRMGDTDPSDPDDPDLLAMQMASAVLDGTATPVTDHARDLYRTALGLLAVSRHDISCPAYNGGVEACDCGIDQIRRDAREVLDRCKLAMEVDDSEVRVDSRK